MVSIESNYTAQAKRLKSLIERFWERGTWGRELSCCGTGGTLLKAISRTN
jgi:hypothetical protein